MEVLDKDPHVPFPNTVIAGRALSHDIDCRGRGFRWDHISRWTKEVKMFVSGSFALHLLFAIVIVLEILQQARLVVGHVNYPTSIGVGGWIVVRPSCLPGEGEEQCHTPSFLTNSSLSYGCRYAVAMAIGRTYFIIS